MKRTWLLFAQAVTVLLAAYFVVATLKPEWLNKRSTSLGGVVSIVEAPAGAPAVAAAVLEAAQTWEGEIPGRDRVRIIMAGAPPRASRRMSRPAAQSSSQSAR